MIREAFEFLTRPLRRRLNKKCVRWSIAHKRAEDFLRRVKRDFKKKKMVGSHFAPLGTLPESYVPLPKSEDTWIDVGPRHERLSVIMEYYARHYRYNPLSNDEDVSFYGPPEAADRFWKGYEQGRAIEFYVKALEEDDENLL